MFGNPFEAITDVATKGIGDAIGNVAGFDFGAISGALGGVLNGDFSGLMKLGADAFLAGSLGPFAPMAMDLASSLMNGGGLDLAGFGSLLEKSGIMPGSDLFGAATSVFEGIASGQFSLEEAANLLGGLGVASPELLGIMTGLADGTISLDSILQGFGGPVGNLVGGLF